MKYLNWQLLDLKINTNKVSIHIDVEFHKTILILLRYKNAFECIC